MLSGLIILTTLAPPALGAWRPGMKRAIRYASSREGEIGFAVVGPAGRLYRHHAARRVPAASVLKVMFMVAYLRHPSVRDRPLRTRDRRLLRPMIRRSDNDAATRIADFLGPRPMRRLARRAGMRHFGYTRPWGLSTVSARDQARFMFRLEDYIPNRHDPYARNLLSHIVPSQRWGIPKVTPDGWTVYFKGGWGTGTGRVTHQVAFLEMGDSRISLAVLIEFSPSHSYGTWTVRGVAKRLLNYVA
jgi:hypothetical protein